MIDADAITNSRELTKKIVSFDLTPYIKVDDLLDFIDKIPTAYDVEKVVEELDNKKYWEYDDEGFSIEMIVSLGNAINIVRKGGAT